MMASSSRISWGFLKERRELKVLIMVTLPLKSKTLKSEKHSLLATASSQAKQDATERLQEKRRYVDRIALALRWDSPSPAVTSLFKRLMDIAGAIVGLSIVAVALLPIAIAVKKDGGPLFFSQIRYGYRGRPFRIWKFRSMKTNAEALKHTVENEANGLIFKNEADPRITTVGRFLRRTSLDELPQFWNVLKGDMSLVGTRPPVVDEVAEYEPHHWQRLAVKPGMTGKWQTSGRSSIKDFEQVVEMDINYQKNWSLWADVVIIFKTIAVVFGSKDAC